jgi:hypothetical protein
LNGFFGAAGAGSVLIHGNPVRADLAAGVAAHLAGKALRAGILFGFSGFGFRYKNLAGPSGEFSKCHDPFFKR